MLLLFSPHRTLWEASWEPAQENLFRANSKSWIQKIAKMAKLPGSARQCLVFLLPASWPVCSPSHPGGANILWLIQNILDFFFFWKSDQFHPNFLPSSPALDPQFSWAACFELLLAPDLPIQSRGCWTKPLMRKVSTNFSICNDYIPGGNPRIARHDHQQD